MNMQELGIINDMEKGWYRGEGQPLWHNKVYKMWKHMWDRCKNSDGKHYEYYKDCKIYEGFKYLSNYVDWIMKEPRFEDFCKTCDKISWSIDKDSKCLGNKNYYPEYMTLMTRSENCKERINRVGSPTLKPKQPVIGIKHDSIVLLKSTIDGKARRFDSANIRRCINKKQKTHKGYKWYKVNYKHNIRLRK